MNRFCNSISARVLALAIALTLPGNAFACATCYGQSDSPLAQGMNWGIMTLLCVVFSVMVGIVAFFVHVGRKSAALQRSAAGENQIAKIQ